MGWAGSSRLTHACRLAFSKCPSLRNKLRLLYTIWCGKHAPDAYSSHRGHYQVCGPSVGRGAALCDWDFT
jgi:hypothetical protein